MTSAVANPSPRSDDRSLAPATPPGFEANAIAILDGVADAVIAVDRTWRFAYLNAAATHLLQQEAGELIGRPIASTVTDRFDPALLATLHRAGEEQTRLAIEAYYPSLDRWLNIRAEPVANGLLIYATDLTRWHGPPDRGVRGEDFMRAVLAASVDIIWTTAGDGLTVATGGLTGFAGRLWTDFTGQTADEILGDGRFAAVHPDDRNRATADWRTGIAAGDAFTLEYRLRRRDDDYRVMLDRAVPIRDAAGTVIGWAGTCLDVTQRRAAQRALRESEERLRIALAGSPIVVYQQDRDLRYIWLYNYPYAPEATIIGKSDEDLLSPEEAAPLVALKRRVMATGEVARAEIRSTAQGKPIHYDLVVEPWRDDTGAIAGVTGSAVDITDRKDREERIARLQELTAAVSEAATAGRIIEIALSRAVPAVGAQGGTVTLLTADGVTFELAGSRGMPRHLVESWHRYPVVGPYPLSDAARSAEPVWIEEPDD
jgi:PAS domain S-box-containing protein